MNKAREAIIKTHGERFASYVMWALEPGDVYPTHSLHYPGLKNYADSTKYNYRNALVTWLVGNPRYPIVRSQRGFIRRLGEQGNGKTK